MFSKSALANLMDRGYLELLKKSQSGGDRKISLTPVFHVEKLYNDKYFTDLLSFCKEFREMSGARAVLTCMTPLSPILARELLANNFSTDAYWDRLSLLKEHGIIGLHGHFVRGFDDVGPIPMHCFFHDFKHIKCQIEAELDALVSFKLIGETDRVYSAGWWFTSRQLRAFLVERGFTWDYSVSSSQFNRSQGSDALELEVENGMIVQRFRTSVLRSPVAVSSISGPRRPFHAASKIWRQGKRQGGQTLYASLYSHDYDLHRPSALKFVEQALRYGFAFSEPTSS